MLSETLASLTRRIAEEFDHLSDSDASPQASVPSNPRLTTAPRGEASGSNPSPEEASAPESAQSVDSRSGSDASNNSNAQAAGSDRRPAKKATASKSDPTHSSDSEEPAEGQRVTKDWQRTVIN